MAGTGRVLFLQRAPRQDKDTSDLAGCWNFPGGGCLEGETFEETMLREVGEEIGAVPFSNPKVLTRAPTLPQATPIPMQEAEVGEYVTFGAQTQGEFVPKLDDESSGWAWAPPSSPPGPLHPGCQVSLDKVCGKLDELGVAEAIRDGKLVSPQEYENLWLFAIRLTGTGASYRTKHDEHVWRDPSLYLDERFLRRVLGVPVIVEHPVGMALDTKEFKERVIGTVMLAWIKGEEVWGIARVYDQGAAQVMRQEQLSTSPAVVFADVGENLKGKLDDGSAFLVEGAPKLVDHVAICTLGVWDKSEEPTGVDRGGVENQRIDELLAGMNRLDQRFSTRDHAHAG